MKTPMFTRPCGDTSLHPEHTYVKRWVKQDQEPVGWFPPGSYADMPDEWDATYRCRGVFDDEPVRGDTGEHAWQDSGRGTFSCSCGDWKVEAAGPDLDRYSSMAYRAWERHVKQEMSPKPSEPTHFAPYGSTNALCDETVPRRVGWDTATGEYNDERFTTRRERVTCPECLWRIRMAGDLPDLSFAERERRAQGAWDATRNAGPRERRPMTPDYRAGYHQALIDTVKEK